MPISSRRRPGHPPRAASAAAVPQAGAVHELCHLILFLFRIHLVRNGERSSALHHLEIAARLAPENARQVFVCAVALRSTGRVDDAVEILRQSLESSPFDRDLLATMVDLCREVGDLEQAEVYNTRLVELKS